MCFEYILFCFVFFLFVSSFYLYPLSIRIIVMCSISIVTDLSEHGWFREQDCLKVVWDSPENLQKVQRTVDFLIQGCQCKTGCTTLRCGCTKENIRCGPSCHCINCKNTKSTQKQSKGEQEIDQEVLEEIKDLYR